QRTFRAAQANFLKQWAQAGLRQQTLLVLAESLQMATMFGLTGFIVARQFTRAGGTADLLLLIYWSLAICMTGQQIATVAWGFPALRNTLLRCMEVLGSPEDVVGEVSAPAGTATGI